MATVIPDELPSRASAGEKRLARILAKLPEGCLAYYEPLVDNRLPDFVVILPTVGVLVIEVKGWFAKNILEANTHDVHIEERQGSAHHPHPLRQARGYAWNLVDRLKLTAIANPLFHADGPRAGSLRFPIAWMTVLSNASRENIEDRFEEVWDDLFPPYRTLFRDNLQDLEAPETCGETVLRCLKGFFDPWWEFGGLGENDVRVLRRVIHPTGDLPIQEREDLIPVLDLRQENLARSIHPGHTLIRGVVGSGKTLILLSRARLVASEPSDPPKQILVLCYNRCLREFLVSKLVDVPTIEVKTFHQIAWELGQFQLGAPDEQTGTAVLGALLGANGQAHARRHSKDAVFIDEAQDFAPSWFRCALQILRPRIGANGEEADGDLVIVGDGDQRLYPREFPTWADLGINIRGRRSHYKDFHLDKNYRNTIPILTTAELALVAPGEGEGEHLPEGLEGHSTGTRIGIRPSRIQPIRMFFLERAAEIQGIVHVVNQLMNGHWFESAVPPVAARDIAILYPRLNQAEHDQARMGELLAAVPGATWITPPQHQVPGAIVGDGLKILTAHASRGLEFEAVLVMFSDRFGQYPEDRNLFFVAMTRAKNYLAISATGQMPFA